MVHTFRWTLKLTYISTDYNKNLTDSSDFFVRSFTISSSKRTFKDLHLLRLLSLLEIKFAELWSYLKVRTSIVVSDNFQIKRYITLSLTWKVLQCHPFIAIFERKIKKKWFRTGRLIWGAY